MEQAGLISRPNYFLSACLVHQVARGSKRQMNRMSLCLRKNDSLRNARLATASLLCRLFVRKPCLVHAQLPRALWR